MAYLYITTEKFCSGNASATRIMSFCKILTDLDKEVIVLSLDEAGDSSMHEHQGIKYISLRNLSETYSAKVSNYLFHTVRLKKYLKMLSANYSIEGVFFYNLPLSSVMFLKSYTAKKKVKLFHDSVEWYSPEQFKWGSLSLPYMSKNILNKYLIDNKVNVFAISSYLNDYYASKGIRSIRLPIMLDMAAINSGKDLSRESITLVYAGSPGKKDYLREIIEGLGLLEEEELKKINLVLLGVNKSQLGSICGIPQEAIEKCGESLKAMGRVSRQEVLCYLQKADFTVLLRNPVYRYAKAGFPTKVVESLATGTPVICNLTSDLHLYLKDGENSIIVKDCSSTAFKDALRRVLSLSYEERLDLCRNARIVADNDFDYRKFIKLFKSFLCKN